MGHAERHAGVIRADGSRKPAYDALLALAKPAAPAPVPPPPAPPKTRTESEYAAVVAERDAARNELARILAAVRAVVNP